MKRAAIILPLALALSACGDGTNPLFSVTEDDGGGGGSSTCDGNTTCSGEVNRFTYNPSTDVVSINNLPFDLDGTYVRDVTLDRNGFRGYRNSAGDEDYVALFSASLADKVSAGVVATDGYINFGYGGTMYTSTGATLPNQGEATFEGPYAGLRVYEGDSTEMGSSTGVVKLRMDFDDFDVVGAIDVLVVDRQAFDSNGNLIGDLPYLSGSTTDHDGIKINATDVVEVFPDSSTGGTGTLEGIFGGTVGAGLEGQVAGVVVITSADDDSGLQVMERGAFIADQTGFISP
ncbi:hypothetical protein [Frigidibacter sp. ROC022]|uniref:hypothetical protein n=1 Tax=Frigidibacter sp. ROC022 TaxID=2971796 RepID=UPI00215A435C|nr:hypothetical protein [Frigidibacter sp. ROC022]MCR8723039.1 hypothetical protein [Frigidibacter sp. ROC022]